MTLRSVVPAAVAVAVLVLACGPIGPFPGGPLRGNEVNEPVSDWGFASSQLQIQIETRPESPYSVNVWCVVREGRLYVPSGKPEGKRWVRNVLEDERVRVRIRNDLYLARAVRVSDPDERSAVLALYLEKYNVPDPELPGAEREVWFFRIDPRSG
jgi:hypothetical protein